jgi:hypothetical protein
MLRSQREMVRDENGALVMNNQQAPKQQSKDQQTHAAAPKVEPTGRPLWQVSLKASLQRRRKRLKASLYASALQHCPAFQQTW